MIVWTKQLFDRLRSLPGVTAVGMSAVFTLRGQVDGSLLVLVQGDALESADRQAARQRLVTPGFFEAMGVPILAGRDFSADDRRTTAPVAIVNGEFVRRYLNGKDPLRTSFAIGYPVVDTKV